MSKDLSNLISSVVIVISSLWAGFYYFLYRKAYLDRVKRSKEIGELSDVVALQKISSLIGRFDSSVKVRIANDANAVPQAATFYWCPKYIVMPPDALQITKDNSGRSEKYLLASIAHELGHIQLANKSTWVLGLCGSGMFGALLFFLLFLLPFRWTVFLYSLLAFLFFFISLNIISWIGEFQADAFAVTDARIPISDLAEALTMLENQVNQRHGTLGRKIRHIKRALGILCNTHPSLENRIRRLKARYNKQLPYSISLVKTKNVPNTGSRRQRLRR